MKGQLFTSDAVTATIIITLSIITLTGGYWHFYKETLNRQSIQSLEQKAYLVSQVLTQTAGNPENWSESDIISIGLLDEDGHLSTGKLDGLETFNYSFLKTLTGTGNYEINVTVMDLSGNVQYSVGESFTLNDTVVTETRYLENSNMEEWMVRTSVWIRPYQIEK